PVGRRPGFLPLSLRDWLYLLLRTPVSSYFFHRFLHGLHRLFHGFRQGFCCGGFRTGHYPVLVSIYGGPDSPRVKDVWGTGCSQWWAYHDVIQVVLDNRVSGPLGKKGLEAAYRHLATVEVQDFIDGLKYFLDNSAVNKAKTGVYGFSFGGTMTTLLVTEGCDYFKYGIAGGGVYDWALYDTHYTERYMDTPQVNPEGYASTRVMERVSKSGYKGDRTNMLRITHGTADDNVHFQNTLQLVDQMEKDCKDLELAIYPEEYHGYRGLKSRHSTMQDYKFWYRYLLRRICRKHLLKNLVNNYGTGIYRNR
ncbi:MAG: prolyl oligopeptidase family serine peptidase, partial [Bacteroidales bacterium]|nr:prolyl oligopeptidase family serine peptidase [Bacteroidales bacterium]